MLVLRHGTDVLLEKRPATGIWGGLWSLPELASEAEAPMDASAVAQTTVPSAIAQRFGFQVKRVEPLAPMRHAFTHFTLDIRPLLADVAAVDRRAGEPGAVWLPLAEVGGAALPAPVKRLLLRLGRSALGDQPSLLEEAVQDL
jgi:A/G-specific adenine glycosylase